MTPKGERENAELSDESRFVACHHCDLLVELPRLDGGAKASCPQCAHTLRSNPNGGVARVLSLAVAASGLFVLSNAFPFMTFKGAGQEQVMTLLGSVVSLYQFDSPALAAIFFALVIALPGAHLVLALALLAPLARGRRRSAFPRLFRWIFYLGPWAMVDVFLLGVLVSLTKIAALATVELGVSFWAFVLFASLFTMLVSSLDKNWLWSEWERSKTI